MTEDIGFAVLCRTYGFNAEQTARLWERWMSAPASWMPHPVSVIHEFESYAREAGHLPPLPLRQMDIAVEQKRMSDLRAKIAGLRAKVGA